MANISVQQNQFLAKCVLLTCYYHYVTSPSRMINYIHQESQTHFLNGTIIYSNVQQPTFLEGGYSGFYMAVQRNTIIHKLVTLCVIPKRKQSECVYISCVQRCQHWGNITRFKELMTRIGKWGKSPSLGKQRCMTLYAILFFQVLHS